MSEPKPDLPPTAKPAAKPKAAKKVVSTESRLAKLGLRTDMDLVLHLPMRYEDETKVYTIRDACLRGGESWQVEGVVTKCEVNFKPRKQLLVTIADETGNLLLRFMNFYGSQVKQLAEGTRVRARAELKHGFFGAEMVHPTSRKQLLVTIADETGNVLRREIADAMRRIDWQDTLPDQLLHEMQLSPFRAAVHLPCCGARSPTPCAASTGTTPCLTSCCTRCSCRRSAPPCTCCTIRRRTSMKAR